MIKCYKAIVWRINGDSQDLASGEKLEHEKMVIWARTVRKIEKWSDIPDIEETTAGISDCLNRECTGGEVEHVVQGSALGNWVNSISRYMRRREVVVL